MTPYPVFVSVPEWYLGGVSTLSAHLVRGLRARGVETSLLITKPGRASVRKIPYPDGIPIVEVPLEVSVPDPTRRKWVGRFLEDHQPCVYLTGGDVAMAPLAPALPADVAVVGVLHGDDPVHHAHYRRLGHAWNAAVSVSRHIDVTARALRPDLAARLHLVPPGVPVDPAPASRPAGEGPLRIIHCGRIQRAYKRILDLVGIAERLEASRVPFILTIAGLGLQLSELARALRRQIDTGTVRLLGLLDPGAVTQELRRHHVFVLTSGRAGPSLSLLEAMEAGCVPVVTDLPSGIPELVEHGVSGFRVPVGDLDAFAAHLALLAGDPGRRDELGRRARETILAGDHTAERMTAGYLATFERLWAEVLTGRGPDRTARRARPPGSPAGTRLGRRPLERAPEPPGPERSCLIGATWRSGSGLLARALADTGLVGDMRREHFWLWEPQCNVGDLYARRSLLYFCRELVRSTRTPNGVFGVKLMWPHLSGVLRGLRELDEFRGRPDGAIVESVFPAPRFVWIRRQDRVAQAVSFYRATMTNLWRVWPDGRSGRAPMKPIPRALPYDFDTIARRLRTIERCEAAWAKFLAGQGLPFLEVTYEEVAADLRSTVLRVLDFMGIDVDPGRIQPVPALARMGGVESAEWTARFRAELAAGRSALPADGPT